jgi:hypothetical protein
MQIPRSESVRNFLGIFPQTEIGADFRKSVVRPTCLAGRWSGWHHGKSYHPCRTHPCLPGKLAANSPTRSNLTKQTGTAIGPLLL